MKIFQSIDLRKLDTATCQKEGITPVELMERAANAITDAITSKWDDKVPVKVFAGPGNNGGDALAVSRMLALKGYSVEVYLFNTMGKLSEECLINKNRLQDIENIRFTEVSVKFDAPELHEEDLVIDGLFGSGLNKPLNGGFAAVVKYLNAAPATVVSIDVPSGLMCEDNTYNIKNHIVHADFTFSLQLPKLAFLFAENQPFTGEWELLDIGISPEAIENTETDYEILEENALRRILKPRGRFAHKGNFGHALLIAGSYGMAGSSVLSARACLRSGVGLLTVHAPSCNNTILQTATPEAMVQHDLHENYIITPVETDSFQAVAIGPGTGQEEETAEALISQIKLCRVPLILDADALNILSDNRSQLNLLPKGTILTPHPKEFDRLAGKCKDSAERLAKARELAGNLKIYIVLKGAWTTVVSPEGKCWFNPTGNPGMATAGSGDVLTGVILALRAQGYNAEDACKLGVFFHGKAGDLAAASSGETGLTAGDIVSRLPQAWK